jgi:hypothetical protein
MIGKEPVRAQSDLVLKNICIMRSNGLASKGSKNYFKHILHTEL